MRIHVIVTDSQTGSENASVMAGFIRYILGRNGFPVEEVVGSCVPSNTVSLTYRAVHVAENLESPITVVAETKSEDDDFNPADFLTIDESIDRDSPIVKGTWVTVRHIVSLIIDGYTWDHILKTHPELCENDIKAAMAYTLAQESEDGDVEETGRDGSQGEQRNRQGVRGVHGEMGTTPVFAAINPSAA